MELQLAQELLNIPAPSYLTHCENGESVTDLNYKKVISASAKGDLS